MSVSVHAQGIKTVHAGGMGVKNWPNSVHVVVECPLIQSNVEVTVKILEISFTIIQLYLKQQLNVNRTVGLQWKLGHI